MDDAWRPRSVGMLADVAATTFALFLAGESGFGLVGVYLFFIFGNGFRYGRRYLFLCTALSLAGFVPVITTALWWRDEPIIGWGLMESIIILPLYVSTLLKRMLDAHAKTEQALRECLERQRRSLERTPRFQGSLCAPPRGRYHPRKAHPRCTLQGCAQRGVAATDDEDVVLLEKIHFASWPGHYPIREHTCGKLACAGGYRAVARLQAPSALVAMHS
jgi:hypothetical protein